MDKAYIAKRLKKYLFLISIIFVVLTSLHLIYSYIYSDAKETAVKGGSISEAIIGNMPSLNPLKNDSEQDKYIDSILYRSLLTYDLNKNKIVGDLAKCDISNLLQIECFLETNIAWSDGEKITMDDVVKTFETLKADNINPIMFSLLQNATITKKDSSILFKNTKKDINFLKIFFQPIVSEKVLNIISKKELEGNFSLQNGIYSGKYKVTNISKDETIGVNTITLEKNEEYYKNPVYIETILLKIFPTVTDFLRNKNSINIFNDKDNLIAGTIPRLKEYKYILPQYVSAFFNTQKITEENFRALLAEKINNEEIVEHLGKEKFKTVDNVYNSSTYIQETKVKSSIKDILNDKGYFGLDKIISQLENQLKLEINNPIKIISNEAKVKTISGEATVKNPLQKEEPQYKIEIIENVKSKTIISPNWVDKYNFISKSDTLLEGKVSAGTTAVYINDYKLQSYTAGSSNFFYRISLARGTLKEGQNTYKIYFTINGKKEFIEEVNFYYNSKKTVLKEKEKELLEKKVLIQKELPKEEKNIETTTNTGSTEKTAQYLEIEKKLETAKTLDKNFFYNNKLEKYSLEIYYISGKIDYEKTADFIKKKLQGEGFDVQIRGISTQNLNKLLADGKKNYDILLAGVNLSYFDFNIYPYFHSTQIDNGYNFSNFRKLDLDIVLEELKSKILSEDKVSILEKKALDIIHNNHLVKTIYTPIISNLVDKNIKGYSLHTNIPENIYRFDSIKKSYVKEDKFVITENKNVIGYIQFLVDTLFRN